jgi:pyridinium-3,5-bisthiocarboxylic acid mononucleotide nickel chelatase
VTTVAWWHCFSGIAGDMALGSLVDAGVGLDQIERELVALSVGGWSLEARPVLRAGLAATQILVHVRESSVVRTHAHIVGLITEARLPPRARDRALATFARLAEVEGRLHRRPPAQVHFHEVGGVDAIIDIVGTCVALELLGVDSIMASPVAQGTGVVRAAHGLLPNPSPAVVELLRGAPTYGTDSPMELTTPTGAALLSALGSGWGPMPAMEITAVGRGAGGRDPDGRPNLVQVVIGTSSSPSSSSSTSSSLGGSPMVLMESNVDDVTGETLADTVTALLRAGAADAWIAPVVGKKGRPAHVISVLGDPVDEGKLRRILMAETGTLGVRTHPVIRWASSRQIDEVEVDGYPVRVKRSAGRIKAEHDDAARVAERTGRPVRDVARLAEEAAHRRDPAPSPSPSSSSPSSSSPSSRHFGSLRSTVERAEPPSGDIA